MQKINSSEYGTAPIKLIDAIKVDGQNHVISTSADYIFDRAGRNQESINIKLETKVDDLDRIIKEQMEIKEYGVEVDFENETFTRLGDAQTFPNDLTAQSTNNPFDNIYPFKGMRRCVLTDDKQVLAFHGESGYEESGATGQVMVQVPKFYYKVVPLKLENNPNGSHGKQVLKAQYWICNYPKQGYKPHPAFFNKYGNEVPYFYLSAYEACVWNGDAGYYDIEDTSRMDLVKDKLSSITNAKTASGMNKVFDIGSARKLANNRGEGWEQQDFTSTSAIQMLIMIEFASTDSQTKIGRGAVDLASGTGNESLPTGQTSVLGNKSGMKIGETNGRCSVSYRGIENFWGNIWKFVDGINIEGRNINLLWTANENGDYINNSIQGQESSLNLSKTNGYADRIGYIENTDYAFLPTRSTGSSSKPINDYFYQNTSYNGYLIALLGGYWANDSNAGCFSWNVHDAASNRVRYIGARLSCR